MGAKRLSFLAFLVWERQRYENNAILDTKPSPRGEGGERSEPDRVLAVLKISGEMRLKSRINESTLSTADAVPLPQEEAASPPKKEANPASLRSAAPSKGRGSRGHSLLPMEGGVTKARRLDGESRMKDQRGDRFSCAVCGSTRIPHSSFFPGIVQSVGKRNLPGASPGL